ncbi:MAG: AAA family ATPase, partial [Ruthenibacterium lactatiformans]
MTQDLNLYTMQTLFEQPLEPIDFLVDGLFAQGLYILGGSPKVGKSWLALQLCLAVCTGTPFLGRKTQQGEVLYLALEDGPQRLHSRALRLTQTAPAGLYLCGQALP